MARFEIFKQLRNYEERLDNIYGSSTIFNKSADGFTSLESSVVFLSNCQHTKIDSVRQESNKFIELLKTRPLNVCLTNEQYDANLMFEITKDYVMLLVSVSDATYQNFVASINAWKYVVFTVEGDFRGFDDKNGPISLIGPHGSSAAGRLDLNALNIIFKDVKIEIADDQDLYART